MHENIAVVIDLTEDDEGDVSNLVSVDEGDASNLESCVKEQESRIKENDPCLETNRSVPGAQMPKAGDLKIDPWKVQNPEQPKNDESPVMTGSMDDRRALK